MVEWDSGDVQEGCLFQLNLNQIQPLGPFDGSPAVFDVEFAVDVLGMGANGAQCNHKLMGNLWP